MAQKMTIKEAMSSAHRQLADAAKENKQSFGNRAVNVPPHLEGMVDKGAAQRTRDKNAQQDRDLNSVPTARK